MTACLVLALLSAGAAAVYATMLEGPLEEIRAEADGLRPLDLRFGYGAAEVRAFSGALSPEGRALYLGRQRRLDTVFMVLFTAALVLGSLILAAAPLKWILAAAAVLGGAADATENVKVARLIRRDPAEAEEREVQSASRATRLKFALTGLVLGGIVLQTLLRVAG